MSKLHGRTYGSFDGAQPTLWTTDVDLIKSVFVKDFDHFINRRVFILKIFNYFQINNQEFF